jgi:subtilase family serine protease
LAKMANKIVVIIAIASFSLLMSCPEFAFARSESEWSAHPLIHIGPMAAGPLSSALTPAQIRSAYNLPSTGGLGTTIAIVNAYDDPRVFNDLITFSTKYGLLPVNFVEHKMASTISTNQGWALETSLDVQWAHAIAPNATILLVEARSNSLNDLLAAVNYAKSQQNVVAVSMSWGGSEFYSETFYDSYFSSSSITFFASSGDSGAGVLWPASSSNVVAVGGTSLRFLSGSIAETAWSGSGGGVSKYEPTPAYQTKFGLSNRKRSVPDVSYNADPNTGVSVYDSFGYGGQSGWFQVGGTSAGAPQWAAIQALGLTASNNNFYQDAKIAYASYFRDITSGSNGYVAGTGYDYVTGLGSPLTTDFASIASPPPPPTPSGNQDYTITASPSSLSIMPGYSGKTTLTVTPVNGFTGTVTLSASAPAGFTVTLTPTEVSGGSGTSTLTIRAGSQTGIGIYSIQVEGTGDTLIHTANITVRILILRTR